MARRKAIRTEMKGTGGGRWTTRADAKASSNVRRRQADREEVAERRSPPPRRTG